MTANKREIDEKLFRHRLNHPSIRNAFVMAELGHLPEEYANKMAVIALAEQCEALSKKLFEYISRYGPIKQGDDCL